MSNRQAILILLAACTGLLFLIFGDFLWHLNDYLFGISNDSIKNYFTFAYYLKFDDGLHFSGMNYPFGEHTFYTDNQPFFSYLLQLIHAHVIPLDKHIIGIINGLTFISMPVAAVVLYFILRKNLLPAWYAIIGAILILLLSPQHYSISDHYALANTLILPLIWLCLLRLFEVPTKISRALWFIIILLASGLVHAYYLPIGTLLFAGYFGWHLLYKWHTKALNWFREFSLLIIGVVPLVLFKLILFFTDPVTDRPEDPLGFLEFKATGSGLLYPVGYLSYTFLNNFKPLPIASNHGYVGLAVFICLFIAGLKTLGYLVKKGAPKIFNPVLPWTLQMGLWASLPLLIFALAIPFRFGLMHWLDYLPVLKQFRFAYRFSWMVYYILTVYGVFVIYQVYRYLRLKKQLALSYGWLIGMLLLWFADAVTPLLKAAPALKTHRLAADFTGRKNGITSLLKTANRNPEDFQMILPVPYYAHGSEKTDQFNSACSTTMYQSMRVAYQTGIPLSNASLSRTSISQTLLHTQLLSSDSIKKELLTHLPSRKPILIVVTDSAEKPEEKRLLQKATFLAKQKNIYLYELPLSALEKIYHVPKPPAEAVKRVPKEIIYQTFENIEAKNWLFRKGAFTTKEGPAILFSGKLPFASDTIFYECSIWVNAENAKGMPTLRLEEYNNQNEVLNQKAVKLRLGTEIYKNWVKGTIQFKLNNPGNQIKVILEGNNIVADELIIRPVKQDFYFWSDDKKQLIRNNYPAY